MSKIFGVVLGLLSQSFTYLSQISLSADFVGVTNGQVFTPEISNSIQEILDIWNITGLSVTVVPRYGEPEFYSWGNRTEDGDKVTENVRPAHVPTSIKSEVAFSDIIPHGICVQGILCERHWHFDGRLLSMEETSH